jgi:hypothetical protein
MARCAVPVAERSVRRTERMATHTSCPARFVAPAPRGRGQRSPLSSTIFETAIFGFNSQFEVEFSPKSGQRQLFLSSRCLI